MFSDEILTSLAKKMQLPTMEFIQNLGDWPLEFENPKDNGSGVAIISWCGSKDTFDIIVPTYELVEAVSFKWMRKKVKRRSVLDAQIHGYDCKRYAKYQRATVHPVGEKIEQSGFSRTRFQRSLPKNIQNINAKRKFAVSPQSRQTRTRAPRNPWWWNYTLFFLWWNVESETRRASTFQRILQSLSLNFWLTSDANLTLQYRYIVSIDGTVAAYRLPYLLGGNSVVLKQDSKFYENFYTHIKPNVHFIPFNEDNFVGTLEYIQTLTDMNEASPSGKP